MKKIVLLLVLLVLLLSACGTQKADMSGLDVAEKTEVAVEIATDTAKTINKLISGTLPECSARATHDVITVHCDAGDAEYYQENLQLIIKIAEMNGYDVIAHPITLLTPEVYITESKILSRKN